MRLPCKARATLEQQRQLQKLQARAESSRREATAALECAGDSNRILNFLRAITSFTGFNDIAEVSLQTLAEYNLLSCIQLRSASGKLSRNLQGYCSPLEESVLSNMAGCDRFVALASRSAFNFPHVSIIVSNMPRHDQGQYDRLKDIVEMIANSIDIHMSTLDLVLEAVHRGDTLLGLVHRNAATLKDIELRHNDQREQSSEILNKLVKDIEDSFVFMGLTEGQEMHLQQLARDAVVKAQALYDQAIETHVIMRSLGEGLDAALQQELRGAADVSQQANRIELF